MEHAVRVTAGHGAAASSRRLGNRSQAPIRAMPWRRFGLGNGFGARVAGRARGRAWRRQPRLLAGQRSRACEPLSRGGGARRGELQLALGPEATLRQVFRQAPRPPSRQARATPAFRRGNRSQPAIRAGAWPRSRLGNGFPGAHGTRRPRHRRSRRRGILAAVGKPFPSANPGHAMAQIWTWERFRRARGHDCGLGTGLSARVFAPSHQLGACAKKAHRTALSSASSRLTPQGALPAKPSWRAPARPWARGDAAWPGRAAATASPRGTTLTRVRTAFPWRRRP